MYCCTPKALYNHVGGLSSTTTIVQHPLGWCDSCHRTTAPMRSPHTSYRWRGERVIEPIKWMGMIRRPWLTKASGGNLARTPGLCPYSLREVPWDFFNDHRESGSGFNVSSERRCFLTVQCPCHYTGALGPTQTTGWAPPAGLTNTSSNSNLVLQEVSHPGTDQAQPCLASVSNQSWAAGWYGCRHPKTWL